MENESIGRVILKESARALPWGVMLLVVIAITGTWLKQEVKEAIQYSVNTAIQQGTEMALSPYIIEHLKQNAKEAIQYSTRSAADQYIRAQRELQQKP